MVFNLFPNQEIIKRGFNANIAASRTQGANPMSNNQSAAYGVFLLRAALGVMFLAHAALKIFVFTPTGTAQFFLSLGLPAALGYVTILAELAGGAMLLA